MPIIFFQRVLGSTGMALGAYLLKKTENTKTYIII